MSMLNEAIVVAGLGQILLVLASLAIPHVLRWKRALAGLAPLTRQMFWVHAVYMSGTQLFFGLLSAFASDWLLDATPLAAALGGFLTLYWGARLIVQLFCYDQADDAPRGWLFRLVELFMTFLFGYLTIVYGAAAVVNLSWLI